MASINNQEKTLSDTINNIMPSAERLNFLVGYFYFSGFEEIYKNLEKKHLRILVGLDIQRDLNNHIVEIQNLHQTESSNAKIRFDYYDKLKGIFNESDFFDSEKKIEAFKIFIDKIKDGTLEIRKTRLPNHSKLYIFENKPEFTQNGEFPGTVIFGSSNLTYSGLVSQGELNEVFREPERYAARKEFFEKLWDESVEIVNTNLFNQFKTEVLDHIWIDKQPSPYLVYLRVLEEYFSLSKDISIKTPSDITKEKYIDLKYQTDAIQQAISIINKHNGVIIADVVGLGKSIIASAIAHNLKRDIIVIAPPHLVKQWDDYRYEFKINAKIYSNGLIENALNEDDGRGEKLIVIDEAHKYRNEETTDYALLHRLCQGNKVMLLTATPFNNDPSDIFSMIKLFQIPAKSTIQTVDSLSIRFKELIKEYKDIKKSQKEQSEREEVIKLRIKKLAEQIRDLLAPLLIRRSRLDLEAINSYKEDLERQGISFPKVNPPQILDYDLGDLGYLYEKTLERIAPNDMEQGLKGARYKPTSYLKSEKEIERLAKELNTDVNLVKNTQTNLAQFMKRLLVRRFESSIYSFKKTLDNMILSSEQILKWYEKGKIPIYKKGNLPDVDSLFEETGDDIIQTLNDINYEEKLEKFIDNGLEFVDIEELKPSFIVDLQNDISLLKGIREDWFKQEPLIDPKIEEFKSIITNQLHKDPARKIIIFTEYSDTADYLFDELQENFRVFKYSASDSNKRNKEVIKENFDASYSNQADNYDVLVATDAISEGYNLHRAGTIFNYDIPYNPTRVIQRVGRINRINKKMFEELFIYNFFPTTTGEAETRVRQISTLKIAVIQALLGEDTMVLTSDEELQSFYTEEFLQQLDQQEELSWDAKYKNILEKAKKLQDNQVRECLNLPKRTRIQRLTGKDKGVLIFGRKGKDYAFKLGVNENIALSLTTSEAIGLFTAEENEVAKTVSKSFYPIYDYARKHLFTRKTEVAKDRGIASAIDKIEELLKMFPEQKDYFEDLKYAIKELDALPDGVAKRLRALSLENIDSEIEEFISEVPHKYLVEIRDKAESIDEGEESLILAEELV